MPLLEEPLHDHVVQRQPASGLTLEGNADSLSLIEAKYTASFEEQLLTYYFNPEIIFMNLRFEYGCWILELISIETIWGEWLGSYSWMEV